MVDRRTVIRSALALATGDVLLGTAAAETETSDAGNLAPSDAASVAGAETTVTVSGGPAVLDRLPLPAPVDTRLSALRDRFETVSLTDLGPTRGSIAIDGEQVVGAGMAVESEVDRRALGRELTAGAFDPVERIGADGVDGYRATSAPYAVGLASDTIAVGYGTEGASALEQVAAVLDGETSGPSRLASIVGAVEGRSRAGAALGPETRSRAIDRVPDGTDALAEVLTEATAFAVGLETGSVRSTVTYGVEIDPAAIPATTYWDLITNSTERVDGFALEAVTRDGSTIVVRGSAPTDRLWSIHREMLGLDG